MQKREGTSILLEVRLPGLTVCMWTSMYLLLICLSSATLDALESHLTSASQASLCPHSLERGSPVPTLSQANWDHLSEGESWSQRLCWGNVRDNMSEVCG